MCDNQSDSATGFWRGTSLEDIYRGQGPWNFSTTSVVPSKYHHVLYELPVSLKEVPQPHRNTQPHHWDEDHVRMPYSPHSLFLVKQDEEEQIKPRWDVICEALLQPLGSVEELEKAINSYNHKLPKFTALHHFFNDVLEQEESQHFFQNMLPSIIQLALRLPDLIPGSIPLLKKNHCKSISFSQMQVASLLANAFLCTFIWRKDMAGAYPGINFIRLFTANERVTRQNCVTEKLKCILHYFKRVTTKNPLGAITFERKFVSRSNMPRWDTLDNNLGNTKIHITSSGTIEEGSGFLQVDFANKFVGGGVLGYGCVQEEIRFVICPELIISRLFTEELGDGEALIITGIERYSSYSGYADSFIWDGNVVDETPYDNYGRRKTSVAVIDATRFTKSKDQFHCSTILRELNKAYVGFSSREKDNLSPVATGNWGCGAFNGDPYLKSLIQLMACSAAGRDLVYYSFGDTELRDKFHDMHLFLGNNRVTICNLWRYLSRFCAANLPQGKLYAFIQQSHFDMKSQPTLKQFLCFTTQKRKPESSTASNLNSEDGARSKKNQTSSKISKNDEIGGLSEESPEKEIADKPSTRPKKVESTTPMDKEELSTPASTPIDPEDIIQLFSIMDGNIAPKINDQEELSLLSEVDKLKKVNKVTESEGGSTGSTDVISNKDEVVVPMDVDTVEEIPKPVSFIEDKKRKITDYFCKMTSHVNNYL